MTSLQRYRTPGVYLSKSQRELLLLSIAALFVLINAIAISLVRDGGLTWEHLYPVVVWLIAFGSLFLVLRRFRPQHDPFLLPIISLLSGWGLVILARLVPTFLHRQVIWLVLASLVFTLAILVPSSFSYFRRYRYLWLLFGLLLLGATLLFGVNPSGFGAQLWLKVPIPGNVYFQPSELLKIIMILFLAGYFDEQELLDNHGLSTFRFGSLRNITPLVIMWLFSLVLLIWQRDLGAAALFLVVFLTMLYLATGKLRYVAGGLLLLVAAAVVAYFFYDVVAVRFDTWWNPWPSAREEGYQIVQSLYAIASGNILGQGIGQGYPDFVPVVHSDFTFAAVAEEWGMIGSLIAIVSFALISYRGFRIAALSTSSFRMYLAAGISVILGVQSLLILGGITRLLPLTGVTLPFVSYGGSSLLMSFLMVGFLLNLSSSQAGAYRSDGDREPVLSAGTVPSAEARGRIRQLSLVTTFTFSAVFLLVIYWAAARAPSILERDDNPRLLEVESRIKRGSIVDAHGIVLAESVSDADGLMERVYQPDGSPVIGYYSIEYGVAGVESVMDGTLRGENGDPWDDFLANDLLHGQQEGQDVRLTIDSTWQQLAVDALNEKQGAVVLLSLPDNAIRALASYPTFDANTLEAQFDSLVNDESGPLLNRAIQGQYQPGLAIQPFILAQAAEEGIINFEDMEIDVARAISINGTELSCSTGSESPQSWAEVLSRRCPAPMSQLASSLGQSGLYDIYDLFGLTTFAGLGIGERTDDQFEVEDLEMAMLGQDTLAVTPLQVALALSSLANDGFYVPPKLIQAVEDENGAWRPISSLGEGHQAISAGWALKTLAAMSQGDGSIEHTVVVLSGPSGTTNTWYLGLAPASAPRYVIVVVVEDTDDAAEVEEIGRTILEGVLNGELQ
jgi:cell division protein FtsW (lipid II flippase)